MPEPNLDTDEGFHAVVKEAWELIYAEKQSVKYAHWYIPAYFAAVWCRIAGKPFTSDAVVAYSRNCPPDDQLSFSTLQFVVYYDPATWFDRIGPRLFREFQNSSEVEFARFRVQPMNHYYRDGERCSKLCDKETATFFCVYERSAAYVDTHRAEFDTLSDAEEYADEQSHRYLRAYFALIWCFITDKPLTPEIAVEHSQEGPLDDWLPLETLKFALSYEESEYHDRESRRLFAEFKKQHLPEKQEALPSEKKQESLRFLATFGDPTAKVTDIFGIQRSVYAYPPGPSRVYKQSSWNGLTFLAEFASWELAEEYAVFKNKQWDGRKR